VWVFDIRFSEKKILKAIRRMKEEGEMIRKHRSAIGMLSK
jgi:hypothetical protein